MASWPPGDQGGRHRFAGLQRGDGPRGRQRAGGRTGTDTDAVVARRRGQRVWTKAAAAPRHPGAEGGGSPYHVFR